MKSSVFEFPDRINEFVVDDTLFARAYEETPDTKRALMKTGIARLFEWYGSVRTSCHRTALQWDSGFDSIQQSCPVDFAIVIFDDSFESPARLLAAVVPPLSCGVKNVLTIRMGQGEWRASLLTGLELAGQELVTDMSEGQVKDLLAELDGMGATGVVLGVELAPGVLSSLRFSSRRISFHSLKSEGQAAVWMDGESPIDLEALAFVHPDISFFVHGLDTPLPGEAFTYVDSDFQGFLSSIGDVGYTPAPHVDDALKRSQLVLGPGQEGCWVWPQLRPEHFQFHSTAWTIGA